MPTSSVHLEKRPWTLLQSTSKISVKGDCAITIPISSDELNGKIVCVILLRDVLPSVEPGYLHDLLPHEAPEQAEDWRVVMADLKKHIMPGLTHWQSPNFHAYYPTATSYPSVVAEIILNGLGVVGFTWVCHKCVGGDNVFNSMSLFLSSPTDLQSRVY